MKIDNIDQFAKKELAQDIAQICGEVTVECSDAAGVVSKQLHAAADIRQKQLRLNEQSENLFRELTSVVHSTDDASELSKTAKIKLQNGNETIENALASFESIIELIERQSHQITTLSQALEQVKQVTSGIDQIAKTTNMLALNATIEAEKAGDAGATFAVVASEVKKLSNDTRSAADEITQTVNSLSDEARVFMNDLKTGVNDNKLAQRQMVDLKSLVHDVAVMISDVEAKNMDIAYATGTIYETENANIKTREEVREGNEEMHNNLIEVHKYMTGLEEKSNEMFDVFVKSGLSMNDNIYVEKSIDSCNLIKQVTEDAIDSGVISMNDIFDKDLKKIDGSNPERFYNRLTNWADENWRPIFDSVVNSDVNIITLVCNSQSGYLPTHLSKMSKQPTGDILHDTSYCRNGRIILFEAEHKIKHKTDAYTMAVYRQEGDGNNYKIVRNVYVPLYIKGRRWGDVELAYEL